MSTRSTLPGLLILSLLPSCALFPRDDPSEPGGDALAKVREHTAWQRLRRHQLDQIFERVVNSDRSQDAGEWLRVYVLTQVADEKDRTTLTSDLDHLRSELSAIAELKVRARSDFTSDLASLRDDVRSLREILTLEHLPAATMARTVDDAKH